MRYLPIGNTDRLAWPAEGFSACPALLPPPCGVRTRSSRHPPPDPARLAAVCGFRRLAGRDTALAGCPAVKPPVRRACRRMSAWGSIPEVGWSLLRSSPDNGGRTARFPACTRNPLWAFFIQAVVRRFRAAAILAFRADAARRLDGRDLVGLPGLARRRLAGNVVRRAHHLTTPQHDAGLRVHRLLTFPVHHLPTHPRLCPRNPSCDSWGVATKPRCRRTRCCLGATGSVAPPDLLAQQHRERRP
jgi:hypothetical protein